MFNLYIKKNLLVASQCFCEKISWKFN